jgi:hypothetical protein
VWLNTPLSFLTSLSVEQHSLPLVSFSSNYCATISVMKSILGKDSGQQLTCGWLLLHGMKANFLFFLIICNVKCVSASGCALHTAVYAEAFYFYARGCCTGFWDNI